VAGGDEHEPVLVEETLAALLGEGRTRIVDGTVGTGGHAAALLDRCPSLQLLGLDRDGDVLDVAQRNLASFGDRVRLRCASYADLARALDGAGWDRADGVLLDLGVSSYQLAHADRGFSFMHDGPIDLRFDREEGSPASALLDRLSETELATVLRRYGEEPKARSIARVLKEARPRTTGQLAELVCRVKRTRGGRVHPATKVFQALRIAVNQELDHLATFLRRFHRSLAPAGRAAIIAYHSLEDRQVKRCFTVLEKEGRGRTVTRRPVRPSACEVARNRRSRSARLRVFQAGGS
jgi:16S rRNA (cytosine1402-N4)-methyltransferase